MERKQLLSILDKWYARMSKSSNLASIAEDIIMNNNASEDDSDPDEGFMATMSDKDIRNAIIEMKQAYNKMTASTVQDMIDEINASPRIDDYHQGFLDACSMIQDEYHIKFKGL